jgi:hypothetical protein
MRLSGTREASLWLSQFAAADIPRAMRLLDDLTIVTPLDYLTRIKQQVETILQRHSGVIAMYPIWDIQQLPPVGWLNERGGPAESVFALDTSSKTPGEVIEPPKLMMEGSVGSAIHIIGDVVKEFDGRVLDRPSLGALRRTRCTRILLLDDIIGSGQRVTEYLESFYLHPTVKSWCSHPGLQISIVCFAARDIAVNTLVRMPTPKVAFARPPAVEVLYDQLLFSGRSYWSAAERVAMEDLCDQYAALTDHPHMPHGYRGAFTMIVFPYSVPDTAPAILWSEASDGRWKGLFPNRAVPSALLRQYEQIRRDPVDERLSETLARIGQQRLSGLEWTKSATPTYRKLVLFLAVVARGFRRVERIAEVMEVSKIGTLRMLAHARQFGLIDQYGVLTSRGQKELSYARSLATSAWEPSELHEQAFYFPKGLRVRQRSI